MSFWAVAQTESQREHSVRIMLMRQGFETYCPRIRYCGRIIPLFPSYVFTRIGDDLHWYRIRWTFGIVKVLMNGEQPAKLGNEIIDNIREREVGGLVKLPRAPRLQRGQNVRIIAGSFRDKIGIYDGMSGRERDRILLSMLGRAVVVEISPKHLVPAADAR